MAKEQRSNKWAFLFYRESAPENYLEILEDLHIPFVLSPWHDKDINRKTGELKKAHKHVPFSLIHSKVILKYLNSSRIN